MGVAVWPSYHPQAVVRARAPACCARPPRKSSRERATRKARTPSPIPTRLTCQEPCTTTTHPPTPPAGRANLQASRRPATQVLITVARRLHLRPSPHHDDTTVTAARRVYWRCFFTVLASSMYPCGALCHTCLRLSERRLLVFVFPRFLVLLQCSMCLRIAVAHTGRLPHHMKLACGLLDGRTGPWWHISCPQSGRLLSHVIIRAPCILDCVSMAIGFCPCGSGDFIGGAHVVLFDGPPVGQLRPRCRRCNGVVALGPLRRSS